MEAVLSGRAAFGGRSALRSWLTAVLKHKIVDRVRRDANLLSLDADADDDAEAGPAFHVACPQPRPDEVVEQRERLARVLKGIDALPAGRAARCDAAARDRGRLDRIGVRRARHQPGEPVRPHAPGARPAAVLRRRNEAPAKLGSEVGSTSEPKWHRKNSQAPGPAELQRELAGSRAVAAATLPHQAITAPPA